MAGYGYVYRSSSTYNTVRDIEPRGPVIKPFIPFVPNTNSNAEGSVTKKTIVPVASKPYSDDYPARGDHDYGSPRKAEEFLPQVQNEASRPARLTPVSSTDWRQSPQPTTYNNNRANGYGDYGSNKDGRKPVGVSIRNDNYDGYNGDYGNKEGRKPFGSTIRNDNYDGYNSPNGYGDYGNYDNKEGRKPIEGTIRKDNYDGYNSPNGYGDYGNYDNKEGRKLIGGTIRKDTYDGYNSPNGYGDYGNYDGYNGANNGYGGYGNNKDGQRPFGSTAINDNYDGYRGGNGYGHDYGNYSNKEGYKPSGNSILNDNYAEKPNKIIPTTRPKISTAWTASPRKGTQLSEPTNDIDKAMELLRVAAKLSDHSNKGGHDETTSKFSKGMELAKEAERLRKMVTGTPQSMPNKDYGDATRRYGNLNFSSRPSTSQKHVTFFDGRDDTRSYGNPPIIDSWEAEKRYKGKRV